MCRTSGGCEKLNRLSDEIYKRARKQQIRKRILNPLSNKFPQTVANYRNYTGKQNINKHSPNYRNEKKKKENYKKKYQQMYSDKWENEKKNCFTGQGSTRKAHWNG